MGRRSGSGVVTLFLVTIFAGCRHTPAKNENEAKKIKPFLQEPLRLSPFHVRSITTGEEARKQEENPTVEIYDAAELFRRASAIYRLGKFEEARFLYQRVADEFPLSVYAAPSLYNAGLSFEHLGEYANARDAYEMLVSEYPTAKDVSDALFRMMGCAEALETWAETVAIAERLLTLQKDLTALERVECLARKGAALVEMDEDALATQTLREAVYRFQRKNEIPPQASVYYAAMARFKLGEILEKKMQRTALPPDEEVLKSALETKCGLLLDAQMEYTDAIRMGHPHWAAAAAYRIGWLYRVLWSDMTEAPPPADLNNEEREIYLQVLKGKIQVLLKKALEQWERVVKMAKRLNFSNEWVAQAQKDIEEIRVLMIQHDIR